MIGRNELCPCGSGKKYKKCCLQKNQLIQFTTNKVLYVKGLYKNMENKIYEYSNTSLFHKDKYESIKKFYICKDSNSIIDSHYNTYYVYDYNKSKGNNIIDMFIEDNKLTLSKIQMDILLSMKSTSISIFKIENMDTTKLIIRDYLNDNKIVIEDINAFKNLKVGESIIGRPINVQGTNIMIDECVKVSNRNVGIIIDSIKKSYNVNNDKNIKNIKDFIIYNSELIYKFVQQILLNDELCVLNLLNSKIKNMSETKLDNNLDINIYNILKNNIEDRYLQKCVDLWNSFVESNKNITGNESGWAAAIEYYIKKDLGEIITQAKVSEKYQVSPRTLGKRYKQLKAS